MWFGYELTVELTCFFGESSVLTPQKNPQLNGERAVIAWREEGGNSTALEVSPHADSWRGQLGWLGSLLLNCAPWPPAGHGGR